MARSRNIKPSIFLNEDLGVADPHLTLLFISLWCLADKEGKLEDRPLRIRAATFPYRDIELSLFNGYLTQLEQLGFITRYEVGNLKIIKILNFLKHQSPHSTEKASELPEPYALNVDIIENIDLTVRQPLNNGELTQAKRPDSLLLIPDSLIPDSSPLTPQRGVPAIGIYREVFPKFKLTPFQEDLLSQTSVLENEFRETMEFWAKRGYREKSVDKILNCYKNGSYKESNNEPKFKSERERREDAKRNEYNEIESIRDEVEQRRQSLLQKGDAAHRG